LRREPGAGARLFFALWPDPGWCEQLLEAAQPLIAGGAGRSVAKSDLHVTLCFLGAVAEDVATRLPERAARIESAAFELLFDAFEYWPRSRILAASCSIVPVAASELARRLRSLALELGLQPDLKPLRPHITLLRAVTGWDARSAVAPAAALRLALTAGRFYLAQSHALGANTAEIAPMSRYTALACWPLRAAPA
jgi:RNA 2',3'-cyclic 3'-phosphodiesterase